MVVAAVKTSAKEFFIFKFIELQKFIMHTLFNIYQYLASSFPLRDCDKEIRRRGCEIVDAGGGIKDVHEDAKRLTVRVASREEKQNRCDRHRIKRINQI